MAAHDDAVDADAALVARRARSRAEPSGVRRPARGRRRSRRIDEQGLAALSMRRLGSTLGVEAMALYRHVAGRERLLDAVVEHLMATMWHDEEITQRVGPPLAGLPPAPGPRRPPGSRWTTPGVPPRGLARRPRRRGCGSPLRSLDWRRGLPRRRHRRGPHRRGGGRRLPCLHRASCDVTSCSTSRSLGRRRRPLDVAGAGRRRTRSLDGFPLVRRLRPGLSQDRASVEFEESLESLLDRLTLVRSEHLER